MKMSIWNLLTIILAISTFGMLVIFGFIFILPNQVLPQGMRPVSIPPTVVMPTSTETPFQFPPTWTKAPLLPTETDIPTATNTPTRTNSPEPSQTTTLLPPTTLTLSVTVTRTPTSTRTNTPISVVVTGASKTATPAKTATKTLTPTICPPGVCSIEAKDDEVFVNPNPDFIEFDVVANDDINDIPVKIVRLLDCADQCETDKWGNYTTKQGGKVSILSSQYALEAKIKYSPPVGFMGMDSIDYKITTFGGLVDIATVTFIVTDGSVMPPTNITSAPAPLSLDENIPAGTVIGIFSATDPDGPPHTFNLATGEGGTNNGSFSVLTDGTLRSAATFNCENLASLTLRVRATDVTGFIFEKAFTVTVNDINEFNPIITSGSTASGVEGAEFTTFNINSSDADCTKTRNITLIGVLPPGLTFTPVADAGTATITGTPDAGSAGSYTVTLRVTDSGGLFSDKELTITITAP